MHEIAKVNSIIDQTRIDLDIICSTGKHSDPNVIADLKRRRLCDKQYVIIFYLVFIFDFIYILLAKLFLIQLRKGQNFL